MHCAATAPELEHLRTRRTCDLYAYPGHAPRPCLKEAMLRTALSACRNDDEAAIATAHGDQRSKAADALLEARAQAVAATLQSRRWEDAD